MPSMAQPTAFSVCRKLDLGGGASGGRAMVAFLIHAAGEQTAALEHRPGKNRYDKSQQHQSDDAVAAALFWRHGVSWLHGSCRRRRYFTSGGVSKVWKG